jgi:hypothetical protein
MTWAVSAARAPDLHAQDTLRWYKGNTHTHTTNSDGDSPPEYVANWYREARYDFLVLSDHNVFTDPATLAELTGPDFILIPGEEVTSSFESAAVHVNALNIPGVVEARSATDLVGTIQANVDAIREAGGVPHVNHPNFQWAFGAQELARVRRDRLLEIYNGHPTVHNVGGGGFPSMERIWDLLLTGGKVIYGIAVDDAHHFQGEFAPERANPGRGWVKVQAPALEPLAIVEALEQGRFFASTGVDLASLTVEDVTMSMTIADDPGQFRYTTVLLGGDGRILDVSYRRDPTFTIDRLEPYVRARIVRSDGATAWIQPVFPEGS